MSADYAWESIITGIEYLLQFKDSPLDYVDVMCDAIINGRQVPFSSEQVLAAITELKVNSVDISEFIPQPHSDLILRQFFDALEERLVRSVHLRSS